MCLRCISELTKTFCSAKRSAWMRRAFWTRSRTGADDSSLFFPAPWIFSNLTELTSTLRSMRSSKGPESLRWYWRIWAAEQRQVLVGWVK